MAARRRYVLPVAAALCAATTLPVWATAGTTAASMKVLHRDLLPAKVLTHSVGAPSATRQWHVGVSVQGRNAAALARLQHAQYDKTSPLYRHFLTPAQYAERYGASATAAKQVRSWLTGKGLHVSYANKAHTYFVATGTVAQVQKTFKVNRFTVSPQLEVFNILNSAAMISTVSNNRLSTSYQYANSIMQPRMFGVGAQVRW